MEDTNVIGGVSPVKKRGARQGSRGGKAAGRATSTGKRRGGLLNLLVSVGLVALTLVVIML